MSAPNVGFEKHSSLHIVASIGAMIFCAESLVMMTLSYVPLAVNSMVEALLDAIALTAAVTPLVYFLLLRPYELKTFAAKAALERALQESRKGETKLADMLARLNVQKKILDHHCLVSQTDVRGRISYANEEFCRVSGYSDNELIGANHRIVNSGHHPQDFWREMYTTLARDGIWQGQVCNRAKDGTLYWVQATNVAERDGKGRVTGYISVRSNITETKKSEQKLGNAHFELKEAIAHAEAASSAKSGFLSTMSHEMRTPLNGVIGAMELLCLESLTDRQKYLVDVATQSSEALLVHINDVLDFSKMEAGKLKLVPKPFNLNKLVGSVVEIILPQVRHGDNEIRTDIAPGIPVDLIGDQVRLRQILLNFASNAAKFTRGGAITISVAGVEAIDGKSVIEFAVTDTGIGIPADRLGELFTEFTMVDCSYTRRTGGTGLGLAISKSLAEMMGGNIGVESRDGHGSRFWFTAELEHAEFPVASTKDFGCQISASEKLSLLLVDDNSTNRLVGSQLVAAAGHEVTLANSGREAVDAAALQPFDVILMDISMPEMDGLQATRLIRAESQHNSETPIVALTAHAVAGDRERFLAAGMSGYLSKPLRLSDLETQLGKFGRIPRSSAKPTPAPETAETIAIEKHLAAITVEATDSPILDPKELAVLAEQTSSEVVATVVAEFLAELRSRMAEIQLATLESRKSDLQKVAHAISGAASSVGARRLAAFAKSIEVDCAGGHFDHALARALKLPAVGEVTEQAYLSNYTELNKPFAA